MAFDRFLSHQNPIHIKKVTEKVSSMRQNSQNRKSKTTTVLRQGKHGFLMFSEPWRRGPRRSAASFRREAVEDLGSPSRNASCKRPCSYGLYSAAAMRGASRPRLIGVDAMDHSFDGLKRPGCDGSLHMSTVYGAGGVWWPL